MFEVSVDRVCYQRYVQRSKAQCALPRIDAVRVILELQVRIFCWERAGAVPGQIGPHHIEHFEFSEASNFNYVL